MECTKGEWKVTRSSTGDWVIATDDTLICREVRHFNAHLIVAAVNACQIVNRDNPQVVAESIKDMYKALRQVVVDYETLCSRKPNNTLLQARLNLVKQTLAKAGSKA